MRLSLFIQTMYIHSFQVGRLPTLPLCFQPLPANSEACVHSELLSSLRFATPTLYTHTPQITHALPYQSLWTP